MESREIGFDLSDLNEVEHACRVQLAQEPAASAVRLELAGCLLARAMFQAGQESMLERLMYSPEVTNDNLVAAVEHSLSADASQLLQDSQRHVMLARELGADATAAAIAVRFGSLLECCFPRAAQSTSADSPMPSGAGALWQSGMGTGLTPGLMR